MRGLPAADPMIASSCRCQEWGVCCQEIRKRDRELRSMLVRGGISTLLGKCSPRPRTPLVHRLRPLQPCRLNEALESREITGRDFPRALVGFDDHPGCAVDVFEVFLFQVHDEFVDVRLGKLGNSDLADRTLIAGDVWIRLVPEDLNPHFG